MRRHAGGCPRSARAAGHKVVDPPSPHSCAPGGGTSSSFLHRPRHHWGWQADRCEAGQSSVRRHGARPAQKGPPRSRFKRRAEAKTKAPVARTTTATMETKTRAREDLGPGLAASPILTPAKGPTRSAPCGALQVPMGWSQGAEGPSRGPTAGLGRPRGHAPQRSREVDTLQSQGSCQETQVPYFLAQQSGDKYTSLMRLPCQARGGDASGGRRRRLERVRTRSRSGSSVAMASSKPTSRTRRPSSRKPQGSGKVLPAASGKAIMAAISKPWPSTRLRKEHMARSRAQGRAPARAGWTSAESGTDRARPRSEGASGSTHE